MDAKLNMYIFVKDSMVQFLFSSFLGNQTSCKHGDQRGIFTCIWGVGITTNKPQTNPLLSPRDAFFVGWQKMLTTEYGKPLPYNKTLRFVPILWKSTFWFGAVCPFRHHLFSVYGRAIHTRDVKFCKTPLATINNVISNQLPISKGQAYL